MSRARIGGVLDLHALELLSGRTSYVDRAQQHRPTDAAVLAAEVRRLHGTELRPLDIATALRLAPDAVLNILSDRH